MKNKSFFSIAILLILILFENLFLYVFHIKGILSQHMNAFGLFVTSLLIGFFLLYRFYNATISLELQRNNKKTILLLAGLFVAALVSLGIYYSSILKKNPLGINISDIIPMIMHMSMSFIHGFSPYVFFKYKGGNEMPTYLPFHWLPFTLAELTNIDYRWICFFVWSVAAALLFSSAAKNTEPKKLWLVALVIPGSLLVLLLSNKSIIIVTVEVMIAAYYMLLMLGINKQNGIVHGLVISLCLLSRYSLIIWLPLYAFVLLSSHSKKILLQSIATACVVVLIFYILPFLSKDITLPLRAYKTYDGGAMHEWTGNPNVDGLPFHLYSGSGFAYYIYSHCTQLAMAERIKLAQRLHLICTLGITAALGIWYWVKKDKIDSRIFLMASFKIYIAVFLFLIQVPYVYLMCVGNFVSIAIFCEQLKYKITPKPALAS